MFLDFSRLLLVDCHNLFSGFYSQNWWTKSDENDPHDCTVEQLETAIQGYFTADALPLSISDKPGISGKVRGNKASISGKVGIRAIPFEILRGAE